MSETILTIKEADLSAITRQLSELQKRLDLVEMRPIPRYVTINEYAEMIGKSPDTVRRRLPSLQSKIEAGVTMIRNPNLDA